MIVIPFEGMIVIPFQLFTNVFLIHIRYPMGLWVIFPAYGRLLKGRSVISFSDNLGMIHCAVNGSASEPDLRLMAHCLALFVAEYEIRMWFEYVSTHSNIADGGSRVGISCEVARSMNIALRQVQCPALHERFPLASLQTRALRFFFDGH